MSDLLCVHCGEPESQHCHFEATPPVPGCECDPLVWDGIEVIPICDAWQEPHAGTVCGRCWHERECHHA